MICRLPAPHKTPEAVPLALHLALPRDLLRGDAASRARRPNRAPPLAIVDSAQGSIDGLSRDPKELGDDKLLLWSTFTSSDATRNAAAGIMEHSRPLAAPLRNPAAPVLLPPR
jgi:hypothetical protein